jgi:HlyD family secretion protein
VIVEAPNSELKLLPGMTATLAFQIEQHAQVLRIPNSALRFRPKPEQVRKEDRAILEGETGGGETKQNPDGADGDAAENDGAPAKKRRDHKVVWIIDGDCLAAVEIVVGPTDKSYTELVSGKLSEGQELVVGLRTASAK